MVKNGFIKFQDGQQTETETGTGKPLYEKPEPFSQHPLEQDFQSRDIN